MVINRAELLSVALNMVKLNIVMNVKVIHVKNIGILINMILLSVDRSVYGSYTGISTTQNWRIDY